MMRLVSRAHYQQLQRTCEELRHQSHQWENLARDEINRYDALLEKYHALKIQGAVAVPESRAIEPKEPDAVQYAIHEKAAGRHGLKLYLTGWAAQQRQSQVADEEIVNRIQNWRSNSDDEQADGAS